ncbi:MAG: toxin [Candidatus Chisholmbacteria bacterium]|nr:toxin [Candidatus Chisholmbacteria bacterium]
MKLQIDYSEEKNLLLTATRGVNFDDVKQAIKADRILDDIDHFNPSKYPHQRILIVKINQYAYAVPYVLNKKTNTLFLKTIYPNRLLTKKYLK